MVKTIIITTGDELLYGTTIDTNSAFISHQLFGTNLKVIKHITIGDDLPTIISVLHQSLEIADLIIITGGLGPTDDDNTVEAICRLLNINQVIDKEAKTKIETFFKSMDVQINDRDYKMAAVPDNSYILKNSIGLAPGFIVKNNDKIILSLPGVPAESEKIFTEEVIAYLKQNFNFQNDNKLSFKITDIRESDANTIIENMKISDDIKWGISVKSGISDLVFVSKKNEFNNKNEFKKNIHNEFKDNIIGENFDSPEDELIYLLKQNGLTISTAESCTGGLLAKRLTDIAGSSDVFIGSVIAYHNRIKTDFLGVSDEILNQFGAVSEETAAEMARGIKNLFKTDIAVSVTGVAGPGGGSLEKPVGTVCFGFYINNSIITKKKFIQGDRNRVRTFSSLYIINFLRKYLKSI